MNTFYLTEARGIHFPDNLFWLRDKLTFSPLAVRSFHSNVLLPAISRLCSFKLFPLEVCFFLNQLGLIILQMKEVMFLLVQMWATNLTIITYSPRKDQSNAYRPGGGKWREEVQEQHRDYLLQSWKLFTLVFLGPCCQRDRLMGNDKVYPRRAKPRSVYHSATWKNKDQKQLVHNYISQIM